MRAIYPDQVNRMNAHIIAFAKFQIIRRASLIELRNASRHMLRQGHVSAAQAIMHEIMRRIGHVSA